MSTAEKPKAGLEDTVATSSAICYLDGDRGVLAYCGYDIHDLARNATFEEVTVESTEMIDAGDEVFAGIVQRGRPRGSRAMVEERSWQVVTVRDGAVTRIEAFLERAQALEAAGLRE